MLQLPIPLFVAFLLVFLGLRALLLKRINPWLIAVVFACALQNVLSVMIHHYGFTGIRMVQPVTAAALPALIWIAFIRITQRPLRQSDFLHFLAVPAVWLASLLVPFFIDVLLPVIYSAYSIAMGRAARGYHGDLPLAKLSSGHVPGSVWLLLSVLLVLSAISDLSISASLALGQTWLMPLIVSLASSSHLLLTGLLMLFEDLYASDNNPVEVSEHQRVKTKAATTDGAQKRTDVDKIAELASGGSASASASTTASTAASTTASATASATAIATAFATASEFSSDSASESKPESASGSAHERAHESAAESGPESAVESSADSDRQCVELLDNYLQDTQAFLDPDLTLQKLSRKLGIPAKRLSSAINRYCQHNVSRHVNNYRIKFASELLAQGNLVTETMLQSGFNTKSNFHREFSRVNGCTPTQYIGNQSR